jgi:hypothetical protein
MPALATARWISARSELLGLIGARTYGRRYLIAADIFSVTTAKNAKHAKDKIGNSVVLNHSFACFVYFAVLRHWCAVIIVRDQEKCADDSQCSSIACSMLAASNSPVISWPNKNIH